MAKPTPPLYARSEDPDTAGVLGEGPTGVYGRNTLGDGNGLIGYSEKGRGVWGHSKGVGIGVLGESTSGNGVKGVSEQSYGLRGHSNTIAGIRGSSDASRGVEGWAKTSEGVFGISETGNGVMGATDGAGVGVVGESKGGVGVLGRGGRLAGRFEGDVEVTGDVEVIGDIRLTSADCAEDFDLDEDVEPGTVMVMTDSGALVAGRRPYDTCVAGVVSGAGSYRPAIVLDRQDEREGRRPIALVGKVFCKVDADHGAVRVGDLLTTSATPGHAMRASDPARAFGSVLGKALRPLEQGRGLVPILVALQ